MWGLRKILKEKKISILMSVDMISIGISFERMLHNTEKILLLNTSNQNNTHSYPFLARSYKHTKLPLLRFLFSFKQNETVSHRNVENKFSMARP